MEPTVFDTTNITSPQNGSNPQPGTCHTLSKGQHAPLLVQPKVFQQNQREEVRFMENNQAGALCKEAGMHNQNFILQPIVLDDQGGSVMGVNTDGIVGTLRKETHGHEPIICLPINTMTVQGRPSDNGRMGLGIGENGDPQNTLSKAHSHAVCYGFLPKSAPAAGSIGYEKEKAPTLKKGCSSYGLLENKQSAVGPSATVRRLTPMECERLQGFPDGWTDIPRATDSKRYAALGNSMTTNVMHWLGSRIDQVDKLLYEIELIG